MGCRSIPVRLNTLNGKYGQISAVAEEIGLHTGGLRLTLVTAIPSFLRDYLGKKTTSFWKLKLPSKGHSY